MRLTSDDHIEVQVDDEHPFFTTVWEQSKAARGSQESKSLTVEVRIGDTVQSYYLDDIAAVDWSDARMRMRTRWRPAGPPTRITTTQPATTTKGVTTA